MTLYTVTAGQTSTYALNNGDTELVSSGGVALKTAVNNGGVVNVFSSGVADATTVSGGGLLSISSGGVASGTILLPGGEDAVFSAGSAIATTIQGSSEGVYGGIVTGAVVSSGGTQLVFSGTAIGTTLDYDGGQIMFSGITSNTVVNFGAAESVAGGTAFGTTVSGGGTIAVGGLGESGTLMSTTLLSGGEEIVSSNGLASGTFLSPGGEIDVTYLSGGVGTASINASDVLTVAVGGAVYTQQLAGSYAGMLLTVVPDSSSGSLVTLAAAPCYCAGTLILTDRGEVDVALLSPGMKVVTATGELQTIRWIGRRSYAGRFLTGRANLLPVCIRPGALGDGLPKRALRVSPLHAMFLGGVLIPAWLLVNNDTIVQEAHCRAVDYIHIELSKHNIVFAEGAMSETFLDRNSRGLFQNAVDYHLLHPASAEPGQPCAPQVESGYVLEAIRARLQGIAASLSTAA